jgi:transmembrane 9 superfamily protein 2/4
MAPSDYDDGEEVELSVNKLTSTKTQLPQDYYIGPFCEPDKVQLQPLNLGEVLMGERIYNSPFDIRMNRTVKCKQLCTRAFSEKDSRVIRNLIDDEYLVNWLVDELPVTTRYTSPMGSLIYMNGFPVGYLKNSEHYINNHYSITIFFHKVDSEIIVDTDGNEDVYRVVGFEVEPKSILHDDPSNPKCSHPDPKELSLEHAQRTTELPFTYDVEFVQSNIKWASRWDAYLKMGDGHVHWFSIINSLTIVVFLSGMVAMILLRTLNRDISKYNDRSMEEASEETGWKLVHGDVFREPPYPKLYAVCIGSGVQIVCMAVLIVGFAAGGFLSPQYRGSLVQGMVVTFMLLGFVAGYVTARITKMLGGRDWKTTTLLAGTLYPGFVSSVFLALNSVIWGQASAGAVPFTTMLSLLFLWFGVSMPLCFFGSYLGLSKPPIELPVRTNVIPRSIPKQPWFMDPLFSFLISGVLPFGAVFTELYFIMASIWLHRFYYLFGFLVLVIVILLVACAEIAISYTYFQLLCEDYRWWWRAFAGPAFSGVYVFLYSILYFTRKLQLTYTASIILYFGYMLLVSVSFTLMTGAIGALSSLAFVRAIFGSIKID